MKLYTEYNLKEVYFKGLYNGQNHIEGECHNAIDSQTPIELPIDEEIEDKSIEKCFIESPYIQDVCENYFQTGAKWMKEQILNQNK